MSTAARQSVLAMSEESEGQECEEGIYLSCNQSLSCSRHAPPDRAKVTRGNITLIGSVMVPTVSTPHRAPLSPHCHWPPHITTFSP